LLIWYNVCYKYDFGLYNRRSLFVQLAEKLEPFKLENLDRINLIEHPEKKGKNRGYAFLDFRTHVDAVAAFVKLQKRDLYLGTDFRAHISFSNTLSQDDEIMEKVQ